MGLVQDARFSTCARKSIPCAVQDALVWRLVHYSIDLYKSRATTFEMVWTWSFLSGNTLKQTIEKRLFGAARGLVYLFEIAFECKTLGKIDRHAIGRKLPDG